MLDTVESLGYKEKLGKYNFKPNLFSDKEQCEEWLDFCERNDMIWFNRSYATLVHKNFDRVFEEVKNGNEIRDDLDLSSVSSLLDHTLVLKSKVNGAYLVTSSPNHIYLDAIKEYKHSIYFIHPNLLEDYSLSGINIALCDWSYEEMKEINDAIYEKTGIYKAFRLLSGSWRYE